MDFLPCTYSKTLFLHVFLTLFPLFPQVPFFPLRGGRKRKKLQLIDWLTQFLGISSRSSITLQKLLTSEPQEECLTSLNGTLSPRIRNDFGYSLAQTCRRLAGIFLFNKLRHILPWLMPGMYNNSTSIYKVPYIYSIIYSRYVLKDYPFYTVYNLHYVLNFALDPRDE